MSGRPTVLVVRDFGTVEYLQDTIDQLPTIGVRGAVVSEGDHHGEAKITIFGDAGFIRYALEKQGYAHVVRISEPGPSTMEIPVTRE